MHGDAIKPPDAAVRGYRIERLIGIGGAAAVYEARRLGPGGPGARVACKIMHERLRAEPRIWELMRQEAVVGLRVTGDHPNLVELLDYFDDPDDQRCIVMELVDGASVDALCRPGQRLPVPVVRRIAREVLEALVHLHRRHVLHRDLSPRNMLVTSGGAVKVADFGIARVMEQGQVHTMTFSGTPMYMSPEAVQLFQLDARADMFSLGAVLYDLLAGAPPCGHQGLAAIVLMHNAKGQFAPLPAETPADLAALVTGLIRIDRNERQPQTAAEALALLRDHDQPMASPEELAALIGPALAGHEQELVDRRPTKVLAPGHVLAPRTTLPHAGRVDGNAAIAVRAAAAAVGGVPARVAEDVASAPARRVTAAMPDEQADFMAHFAADVRANVMAELEAEDEEDAGLDLDEYLAGDEPDEAELVEDEGELEAAGIEAEAAGIEAGRSSDEKSGHVDETRPAGAGGGALGRRVPAAIRFVVGHSVTIAVVVACVLVLGFLVRDRLRGEPAAVEQAPPAEVSRPSPAPPAAVVPVLESPARVSERVDGSRGKRIEGGNRRARPPAEHRKHLTPAGAWPSWVKQ